MGDGGIGVESPGESREGVGPRNSGACGLGESGEEGGFFSEATDADGFEGGAIGTVPLVGEFEESGEGLIGGKIAERGGDFASDRGVGVGGHLGGEGWEGTTGASKGAKSDEAFGGVFAGEEWEDEGLAWITHLGEEPDGASGQEGIGVFEEGFDGGNGSGALGSEANETALAHIDGGAFEGSDLAFGGVEIDLRNDRFKSFWGNAIDSACVSCVGGIMATDTGIEPIGDIDGAVGADTDIAGAEFCFDIAIGATSEEVGASPAAFFIGGHKVKAFEFEASAIWFGEVAEDDIFSSFASEEEA